MFRKQPKIASIEQDIAAMSKETGTAVFSYDEIHHSKVDNELHYDYQKVIDGVSKAQNITANEAEKRLLERGVLRPMPNGEYVVNVGGATRDGGGTNYGGLAFLLFQRKMRIANITRWLTRIKNKKICLMRTSLIRCMRYPKKDWMSVIINRISLRIGTLIKAIYEKYTPMFLRKRR